MNFDDLKNLKTLLSDISNDITGLVISNRYSAMSVPGCLQIPFNFLIAEFHQFYESNKRVCYERLEDYKKYSKFTDKTLKYLSEIIVPCTIGRYMYKNNPEFETQTFEEYFFAAKKLQKMVDLSLFPNGLKDAVIVIGKEFQHVQGLIQIPTVFAEKELIAFIQKIINGQKF